MAEGMGHLVAVPRLRELMVGRVHIGDSEAITRAHRAGEELLPIVRVQMEDADCLLLETWSATPALYAECSAAYDVVHAWVLTPQWLSDARMRYRYARLDDAEAYERAIVRREVAAAPSGASIVTGALDLLPECPPLLLDGRDYPIREMDADAARTMMDAERSELVLDPAVPRCQAAVRIGTEWQGKVSEAAFEQARLDAILPVDMGGMDVLDVGACNGGFSLDAVNRGALCVTAVDVADSGLSELRRIRDAYHLPICTALMDATVDALPVHRAHEEPVRYSLALLLNILHRVADPEALLRRVAAVSDSVVIEAPFCAVAYDHTAGAFEPVVPHKPSWGRYAGTWHFPPAWVARVAAREGLGLESMELGPYMAEQRMIWRLKRDDK